MTHSRSMFAIGCSVRSLCFCCALLTCCEDGLLVCLGYIIDNAVSWAQSSAVYYLFNVLLVLELLPSFSLLAVPSNFSNGDQLLPEVIDAIWPPKCCRVRRLLHGSLKSCRSTKFALHCALSNSLPFTENWLLLWSYVCWLTSNTAKRTPDNSVLLYLSVSVYLPKVTKCLAPLFGDTGELAWLGSSLVWPLLTSCLHKLASLLVFVYLLFVMRNFNFQLLDRKRTDWTDPFHLITDLCSISLVLGLHFYLTSLTFVSGHRSCMFRDGTALSWHVPVICIG